MSKWISVSDRLPVALKDVLVWDGEKMATGNYSSDFVGSEWWSADEEVQGRNITHWIPLPEPPE